MSSVEGQNASVSLPAGSAGLATGNVADFGAIYLNTVGVITSSAILTAGNIELEGSVDNITWYPLRASIVASADFAAAGTKVYANVIPCRYIRSRISTGLVGGTISAVVGVAGA